MFKDSYFNLNYHFFLIDCQLKEFVVVLNVCTAEVIKLQAKLIWKLTGKERINLVFCLATMKTTQP
jgi:hypothetical protein